MSRGVQGVLFILPALMVLLILTIYPIYQTITLSFSKLDMLTLGKEFVGWSNYARVLNKEFFWKAARNMVVWTALFVAVHFLLGYFAALGIHRLGGGQKFFKVMVFLPWTLCLVSVALSWKWLLHSDYGLINSFLGRIGLGAWEQEWLSDPATALYSLIGVSSWYRYPFVMLMVLAGLQTVPDDLISAARIDGASRFQTFVYVTLPWLRNLNGLILVMSVIYAMQIFTPIWLMTGGGPAHYTELFSTLIYRLSFRNLDFTAASSIGTILFVFSTAAIAPYVYFASQRK
jgi:multiple sugar transport system permease protein